MPAAAVKLPIEGQDTTFEESPTSAVPQHNSLILHIRLMNATHDGLPVPRIALPAPRLAQGAINDFDVVQVLQLGGHCFSIVKVAPSSYYSSLSSLVGVLLSKGKADEPDGGIDYDLCQCAEDGIVKD